MHHLAQYRRAAPRHRQEGRRRARRPHRQADPTPPWPEACVQDPQALCAVKGGRRAQVCDPPGGAGQVGGQEAGLQGAQDPAARDPYLAAAQAAQARRQEGAAGQGEERGGGVPEVAGAPPEGGAREEGGEDVAAPLAALLAGVDVRGCRALPRLRRCSTRAAGVRRPRRSDAEAPPPIPPRVCRVLRHSRRGVGGRSCSRVVDSDDRLSLATRTAVAPSCLFWSVVSFNVSYSPSHINNT
mmetsp:Transcript_6206/g.19852  ORF Transcript_6206/g.19852 Transcript_6206/m.19852 type:complete len:241 (-) Transcript_6206:695-1417(-)